MNEEDYAFNPYDPNDYKFRAAFMRFKRPAYFNCSNQCKEPEINIADLFEETEHEQYN